MSLWQILKSTLNEWLEDRASRLAAAVAYYAIFSIAPLLMISVSALSFLFGAKAANDELRPQLTQFIGDNAADFIQQLLTKAAISPNLSFASIVSILLLLYAATNLFITLQDALNTIFDVEPKPSRGLKGLIIDRALSFLMIILVGAFILASVIASTTLTAVTAHLGTTAASAALTYTLSTLVSILLFTAAFAAMFKIMPDIKIAWKDTLIGAAITSVVFNLARIALSFYLSRSATAGPFGAAGSLVVIMLFINYSTQILFLGAEFTQVWARRDGHPIAPSTNAISLDPAYTEPDGVASSTNASGATGSRADFDRAGGAARPLFGRPNCAEERAGGGWDKGGRLPRTGGTSVGDRIDWDRIRSGRPTPTTPKITQINNPGSAPHYPPDRYHPPMPHRHRGAYAELASAAALLAIPLTWLVFKRKYPQFKD